MAEIITYTGSQTSDWTGGPDGADIGLEIGGSGTGIELLGAGATEREFEPLSEEIEDLDSTGSAIEGQINGLENNGLAGLGVGETDELYTNKNSRQNPEIQSEVGIGSADQLVILFPEATQQIVSTVQLFFAEERVQWSGTPHAEQLRYLPIQEGITGPNTIDVGGQTYTIIDTNADGQLVTATDTGKWQGRRNLGQQIFVTETSVPVDGIIYRGADYDPATPDSLKGLENAGNIDTSDFILNTTQITIEDELGPPQGDPVCFGNGNGWTDVQISYSILNGAFNTVNTPAEEDDVYAIQDNDTDLGLFGNDLPIDVGSDEANDALGVGDTPDAPLTEYDNGTTAENAEIQGQIDANDELRLDFGNTSVSQANKAEVKVGLFYSNERGHSERLKVQLVDNGTVVREETVTAFNTGTYGNNNAGEYTFEINSPVDFEEVRFLGMGYSGGYSNENDVSDFVVLGVCLEDLDGVREATTTADNDTSEIFNYGTFADGYAEINNFGDEDTIRIDLSGFGLESSGIGIGHQLLSDSTVSEYFSFSNGTLTFDPSGVSNGASGLPGDPNNSDVVELVSLPGASLSSLLFVS